jgi:pyrroline-5-carboxylate reductase
MNREIGFIGGGNMAGAMIGGLLANGTPAQCILASDPDPATRELLSSRYGIRTLADNAELAASAEIVVLAVKPQVLAQVTRGLREVVQARKPLVLSVAAGIEIRSIQGWLGGDIAAVRAMPNSPCLVRQGITALYASEKTDNEQRILAQNVMEAVGNVIWVQREDLMNAVTAVSGSGPAYFFPDTAYWGGRGPHGPGIRPGPGPAAQKRNFARRHNGRGAVGFRSGRAQRHCQSGAEQRP